MQSSHAYGVSPCPADLRLRSRRYSRYAPLSPRGVVRAPASRSLSQSVQLFLLRKWRYLPGPLRSVRRGFTPPLGFLHSQSKPFSSLLSRSAPQSPRGRERTTRIGMRHHRGKPQLQRERGLGGWWASTNGVGTLRLNCIGSTIGDGRNSAKDWSSTKLTLFRSA